MVLYGGTYTSAGLFLGVLLLLEVMQRVLSLSNHVALIAIGTAAIKAIDILYFSFITYGCVFFFIISYSFLIHLPPVLHGVVLSSRFKIYVWVIFCTRPT